MFVPYEDIFAASAASAPSALLQLRASCDAAPAAEYPYATPKVDDPEHNAEVMDSWRAKIAEARDLFAKLDFAGAETVLKLALDEAAHFGQSSGPVATSLLNLAQLYRRAGRLAEAEPLLERAADVLDQTAGPNNKVTLLALIDLATTKMETGDAHGALASFEDVVARLDVAQNTQSHARQPLTSIRAGCLFSMARAHTALREHGAAEAALRETLRLLEERWGATSPKLLAPCVELARSLAAQGRGAEGAAFIARARGLPELRPTQREQLSKLERELDA